MTGGMTLWRSEAEVALVADEIQAILDDGGEPSDELIQRLAAVVAQGRQKADALGHFMTRLMADAEACENLARRQRERAGKLERARRKLDEYVMAILDQFGQEKVVGVHFTLRPQQNPERVEVEDEQALPRDVFRNPPPYPDKEVIKARLRAGQDVPGARLVRGRHLRIDQ